MTAELSRINEVWRKEVVTMGVSLQGLIKEGYSYSVPRPDSPTHPTVSVVIPALNEAENLPYVLPYIPACED